MSEPAAEEGWGRRRVVGAVSGGLLVVAVLVLLVVGLANRDSGTGFRVGLIPEGERSSAPDIALPVLSGGDGVGPVGSTASLADLRGRPVVLNVWASWCIPCEDEAPVLEEVAARLRARGAGAPVVLGVDVRDLSEDARGFIDEFDVTYPTLRDGTDDTESALQTTGVPETYIIDREGRIAWHYPGPVQRPEDLMMPLREIS